MDTIYLDNAATTPLAPEVRAAMEPWLADGFGNPSARYPLGVRAGEALDEARWTVARALGAAPEGVVFTAGATEANNLAIIGSARRHRGGRVLHGPTEHPSVGLAARALVEEGHDVQALRLTPAGALDLEDAAARLTGDTVVVAQMLVNSEFGSVYPLPELARLARARAPRVHVHADVVQGVGKLHVSLGELGVDSLALSAHKIHGPKGMGVLVLAEGARPKPLIHGGGQEHGLRSGTENVAGAVGLARAVELAVERAEENLARAAECRAALLEGVADLEGVEPLAPDGGAGRAPTVNLLRVPGPPGEVWLHHLAARGVLVSTGSSCQSTKSGVSAGLDALGLDLDQARHLLRFSFSRETTPEEVRAAVSALREVAGELLARSARG